MPLDSLTNLFIQPNPCTTRGAHKRCSMSTPLVNHRPLKGKEDGIFIIAYTFRRLNPANRYWSENLTAFSLILPLKNPLLASRAAFTLTYPHPFSILFFEPMWEKFPHLLPLHYYLLPQLITHNSSLFSFFIYNSLFNSTQLYIIIYP